MLNVYSQREMKMATAVVWKVVSLQGNLSTRQCGNYLASLPVLHYSLGTGKEARLTLFTDISFSSFTDFPLLLQFQEEPAWLWFCVATTNKGVESSQAVVNA